MEPAYSVRTSESARRRDQRDWKKQPEPGWTDAGEPASLRALGFPGWQAVGGV